ncbi:MAG: YidC/Oxa1 family membrane protein insertase [Eubacteriaceae bacterium]|nr:YidC/Oxa1 family membrane protein insertase [Eubacteriaceae bacterium]
MFVFLYNMFGPILHWFYEWTSSYGWSIILFSIFAKIITLPFTVAQSKSTKIMRMMAPYQQRITKKYGTNNEKSNEEILRLYKVFNYKPLAGCLPLLIQWPLVIGLFGVMRSPEIYVFTAEEYANVDFRFLWIHDLNTTPSMLFKEFGFGSSVPWISLIIPIISTVLMVISQRMMTPPNSGQQQNQMMMYSMNIMMLFIFYTASQGLAIYWTVNSLVSVITSYILDKMIHVELPEAIQQKSSQRPRKR